MARVLIVDDEQMVLHSTQRLLASLGYETATHGQAAGIAEAIRRERPDVVLQDVRMPGLDVEALLRGLRSDPATARTPIVLFSASMEVFELEAKVHPDAVLEKPFRPEEAIAAIERATRGRAALMASAVEEADARVA